MIISTIPASNCAPQTIVIGRRGTYDTMQIAFDLSFLIESYGSGTAVLAVKRSQDTSAYPAVVTQEDNTLTWTVSETETYYVGSGECQLMWYVDGGLAKTIIYPMVVMRDILQTTEEPPDGYENWIEHLTELGAETQQNAQDAAQSASEAKASEDSAAESAQRAEDAAGLLVDVSATATTLDPGQPATAEYNDGVFEFGIPKGDKLTYADLTEADKEDLVQGPIKDAQDDAVEAVGTAKTNAVDAVNQAGTTQKNAVNQAGTTQKNAVTQEGTTQVNTVREAGTTQVGRVTTEGNTQVGRVQDKGDEVIASIPSDYSDLVNEVDNLTRQISDVEDTIDSYHNSRGTDDYLYNLRKLSSSSTAESDPNGDRIRVIYKVKKGEYITVENTNEAGVYVFINTNLNVAISGFIGDKIDTSQMFIAPSGYTNVNKISGEVNLDGYLSISLKKTDGTVISDAEWQELFSNLTVSIVPSAEYYDDIQSEMDELYISPFVQKGYTATGYSNSDYRISMDSVVALPSGDNGELLVLIDTFYCVGIRFGATPYNLDTNIYWLYCGDTVQIPKGANYYKVCVTTIWINTQKINTSANCNLHIFYSKKDSPLHEESTKKLFAARYDTTEPRTPYRFPMILHTSDCHGDLQRVENIFSYADETAADAVCVTGDVVAYEAFHKNTWFQNVVNQSDTLAAVCVGNHDVYKHYNTDHTGEYTDSEIYDYFFSGMATKIGNTTGKTWYFKDIADKKLRLISLNLYQYGGGTGTTRWYSHFTDEQLEFLVSALLSTPTGYGILLLTHDSQKTISSAKDADYPEFFQDVRLYDTPLCGLTGTYKYPIYDIVDAFISRESLSRTYTQAGDPSSVIVSADFSSVDQSVEFIAHLTGHYHQDTICYVPGTEQKQLMLNVVCTNNIYGGNSYPYLAELSDLSRSEIGSAQDSFNAYVIDRANKSVKVIRIGQDITYDMKERKYMVIPYAD